MPEEAMDLKKCFSSLVYDDVASLKGFFSFNLGFI
jgi:hypothetical protein